VSQNSRSTLEDGITLSECTLIHASHESPFFNNRRFTAKFQCHLYVNRSSQITIRRSHCEAKNKDKSALVVFKQVSGSQPVGRGRVAVGSRTAASIVCCSLKCLELRISTVCVTSAKPKHRQIFVKFTLSQ